MAWCGRGFGCANGPEICSPGLALWKVRGGRFARPSKLGSSLPAWGGHVPQEEQTTATEEETHTSSDHLCIDHLITTYSFVSTVQICSDLLQLFFSEYWKHGTCLPAHFHLLSCCGVELYFCLYCTSNTTTVLCTFVAVSWLREVTPSRRLSLLVWGTTIRIVVSREGHIHKSFISRVAGPGCSKGGYSSNAAVVLDWILAIYIEFVNLEFSFLKFLFLFFPS